MKSMITDYQEMKEYKNCLIKAQKWLAHAQQGRFPGFRSLSIDSKDQRE